MAITEDKQLFIDVPDNHAQNAGKQLNESNWQDAARTGALTARRKSAIQLQHKRKNDWT